MYLPFHGRPQACCCRHHVAAKNTCRREDEAYAAGSDNNQQFQPTEPNQRVEESTSPSRCSRRPCISPSIPVLDCAVAYIVPPPIVPPSESPVSGEVEANACAASDDDHHQLQLVETHQRDKEWSLSSFSV